MYMNSALNCFKGLYLGFSFDGYKTEEDIVTVGGETAQLMQFLQVNGAVKIVKRVLEHLPEHPLRKVAITICDLSPLISLPFIMFFSNLKQNGYTPAANSFTSYSFIKIPHVINPKLTDLLNFVSNHISDFLYITVCISSVALTLLGDKAYGISVLIPLALYEAKKRGLMTMKISEESKKYFKVSNLIGSLLFDSWLMRLVSIGSFCNVKTKDIDFVDGGIRKLLPIGGPSLKELHEPLIENKALTYYQMIEILDSDIDDFEINYAHCLKPAFDLNQLKSNKNFNEFQTLFDSINWEKNIILIEKKVASDEKFLEMIRVGISATSNEYVIKNFTECFDQFLNGRSKEEYLVNYLKKEFYGFVNVIREEKSGKGFIEELKEVKLNCEKILFYIEKIKDKDQFKFEDLMLKLAIDAGNYCLSGVKRTTKEIIRDTIIPEYINEAKDFDTDKSYELRLKMDLEQARRKLIEGFISSMIKENSDSILKDYYKSIHTFDISSQLFFYEFIPENDNASSLSYYFIFLFTWYLLSSVRLGLMKNYTEQLDAIIEDNESEFFWYVNRAINTNSNLTQDQKELLIERQTDPKRSLRKNQWIDQHVYEYHRLGLFMMGIIKKKNH